MTDLLHHGRNLCFMIEFILLIGITTGCSVDLCYPSHLHANTDSITFEPLEMVDTKSTMAWKDQVTALVDVGKPFVVQGITGGWAATNKWNHSYFKQFLGENDLVSSTFSTPLKPKFWVSDDVRNKTYYGAFINSLKLSETLKMEYELPNFIPESWFAAAGGNEWLHWGWSPCGAKRHMDLTCTSRMSVQVVCLCISFN